MASVLYSFPRVQHVTGDYLNATLVCDWHWMLHAAVDVLLHNSLEVGQLVLIHMDYFQF